MDLDTAYDTIFNVDPRDDRMQRPWLRAWEGNDPRPISVAVTWRGAKTDEEAACALDALSDTFMPAVLYAAHALETICLSGTSLDKLSGNALTIYWKGFGVRSEASVLLVWEPGLCIKVRTREDALPLGDIGLTALEMWRRWPFRDVWLDGVDVVQIWANVDKFAESATRDRIRAKTALVDWLKDERAVDLSIR